VGAACVALLVDYLRNKNQQLREAMVEMKVRQIEKERQLLTPALSYIATLPASKEIQVPSPQAEFALAHAKAVDKTARMTDKPLVRAIEAATITDNVAVQEMDFTSRRRRRRNAGDGAAMGPERKDEEMNSKKAFSDWLIQRAVARAARKMASETTAGEPAQENEQAEANHTAPILAEPVVVTATAAAPEPPQPPPTPTMAEPLIAEHAIAEQAIAEPAIAEPAIAEQVVQAVAAVPDPVDLTEPKKDQIVIEPPAIHGFESRHEPVIIDEFLWQSLFEDKTNSSSTKTSSANSPEPAPIVIASSTPEPGQFEEPRHIDIAAETAAEIAAETAVEETEPPVRANQGFQIVPNTQPAIEPLSVPAGFHDSQILDELKNSELPFSGLVISVGITQNDPRATDDLAQTVTAYIRSLLRESDFACRTGEDEFLLVCPNLTGVAAHRHLSALSERLWDFQLRALGSFLMLFSLGGVDIQREPLAEAIASATERMSQTKRSRKAIVMLTPGQRRRKAV
jgi:hypothetical protein